jgi:DNA-binding CsgD family transcriptional regulator
MSRAVSDPPSPPAPTGGRGARRCATLRTMAGGAAADAFAQRAWAEAYRLLSAEPRGDLGATDLDRFAVAAYLVGEDDEAVGAWEHAHRRHLDGGERAEAARCAFWAAFCLMMNGQMAHAGGWLSRGEADIGQDLDCPARGYLMIPVLLGALESGHAAQAQQLAVQAAEIAGRFVDHDLAAFSMLGHGQALLAMGDELAGLALLDDVMLSVSSGEVGPIVSGIVYCAVILECMQLFDVARATEWTEALAEWCRGQPDLVPYRGQCLVHQSQLLQAAGEWSAAFSAVADARDRLSDPPHPALGLACYQEGELHRLRGDVGAAADAYRRASRAGYEPLPGLALLHLQRGDVRSASACIRRALGEAVLPFQRPALLAAAVEIQIAAGEISDAADAAVELGDIAQSSSSDVLGAMAAHASAAAALASGRIPEAMAQIWAASALWRRLNMPYEAARSSVLVARGCVAMGDVAVADLACDAASETFESLGAQPDLRGLRELMGTAAGKEELSARELEVLGLVAQGKTSRDVAASLSISPHTVRRHLENIFTKLGVRSRAAAVAYAYEHDLL